MNHTPETVVAPGRDSFASGGASGGEMAALIRTFDWSKTAIGPSEGWSQSLRMMVSFLLANRFPLLLWWGPDYVSIYNDAYRPILGEKHPKLGEPARECWSEIWHILKPLIDAPFSGGPATWMDDILLELNRFGFIEETHFTIAYSPVPDETVPSGIGGVLATVHEITEKIVGERRVHILRDLGARTGEARTAEDACSLAASVLGEHGKDVPFALLYLIDRDGKLARLAGAAGIMPGDAAGPPTVALDGDGAGGWPLTEALERKELIVLDDLADRFSQVPASPWSDPPRCAVVVPIRSNKANELSALLVAGVSPRLRLDGLYQSFFVLVGAQIATAIINARAYEEERRRAEALAELDRAKTTFFSNVSHEFRTPLTLMLGPLENVLAAPVESLPQRKEDLVLAHRNGLRLLRLVNTLLDFSRIEAGRIQASYEPVDLSAFTANLASVFRAATERAGLRLTIDCPALADQVWVDREMWEKIVLNLLSNAFKYTLDGGIGVRLRIEDGMAVLTIEDTGTGIPADELPRLFERFYRVEGARGRTHEGTGIGLALVHELTKLHGGTVSATSALDKGSAFTVRVPLGSDHLPQDRLKAERTMLPRATGSQPFVDEALRWLPAESAAHAGEDDLASEEQALGTAAGPRSTVLLADDNADMRRYLERLLGDAYEVTAVADGAAALRAAADTRPDLILADVMMPGLDGFAMLQRLRADPDLRDIPVIILSARAGEEAKVEGLQRGADDYLVKPFSARELLARVAVNIELSKMRARNAEILRAETRRLEQRMAELLAERKLMADLVETTDTFIQVLDKDFRILAINRANAVEYERIYGVRLKVGDCLLDLLAGRPKQRKEAEAVWARALSGESFTVTAEFGDPTLERRWYDIKFGPLKAADGTLIAAYHMSTDVTERLREQARLAEAEEKLRQSQKMEAIGHLTGGVAHDFNNLLQVVLGNLESLKRRIDRPVMPSPAELGRLIESAARGAQRAASLTQRLLAFSRRQPLDPRPTDLNRLLGGMSDLLYRTLGESIAVETVLAAGLWRVSIDPNQLENAVLNLAVNARDAMPGGGKLTIETANAFLDEAYAGAHAEVQIGQYVMLAVSDTGIGMTKEVIASAFDPFFTTKEAGHGTGLGLSQVYGFVKQSSGHIKIYSEPGEGTTIRIYLPRIADEQPVAEELSSAASVPHGDSSEVVLLVEDDEAVRELNSLMLRELGYTVLAAENGGKALKILEATSDIQLLFTDVGLPGGVNGRQLAELAWSIRPGLRVLFTTGYARNAIVHHGRLDPGINLITKPFSVAALATKIRDVLDKP